MRVGGHSAKSTLRARLHPQKLIGVGRLIMHGSRSVTSGENEKRTPCKLGRQQRRQREVGGGQARPLVLLRRPGKVRRGTQMRARTLRLSVCKMSGERREQSGLPRRALEKAVRYSGSKASLGAVIGHPIGYAANQCAPPPRATGDALMSWERQRFQDTISSQIRAESYEGSRVNGEG